MQGELNNDERLSLVAISPELKELARNHTRAVEPQTEIIDGVDVTISKRLLNYLKDSIKADYGFAKVELAVENEKLRATFVPKKVRKKTTE